MTWSVDENADLIISVFDHVFRSSSFWLYFQSDFLFLSFFMFYLIQNETVTKLKDHDDAKENKKSKLLLNHLFLIKPKQKYSEFRKKGKVKSQPELVKLPIIAVILFVFYF
jgi:hypothetical protein